MVQKWIVHYVSVYEYYYLQRAIISTIISLSIIISVPQRDSKGGAKQLVKSDHTLSRVRWMPEEPEQLPLFALTQPADMEPMKTSQVTTIRAPRHHLPRFGILRRRKHSGQPPKPVNPLAGRDSSRPKRSSLIVIEAPDSEEHMIK